MRKRGELLFGQIAKTILAVAVVLILITLTVRLFSPIFDRGDETAKSYMKTLEKELKVVDKDGKGEFFMWNIGENVDGKEFYLVYFGETIEVDFVKRVLGYGASVGVGAAPSRISEDANVSFNSFGQKSNRICICYVEGNENEGYESTCNSCEGLKYPVSFDGKDETWVMMSGRRISIVMGDDEYVFAEI